MDFTREPIVETIITPKDGFRLVIRSSKNPGQEEFLVDALEVISFGSICFYRHLERPKAFIVPASEYEVLEVRESRMPLKAPSFEGTVKLNASREPSKGQQLKEVRDTSFKERDFVSKESASPICEEAFIEKNQEDETEESVQPQSENKVEKRKDRKRGSRRRRGGRDEVEENKPSEKVETVEQPSEIEREFDPESGTKETRPAKDVSSPPLMTTILPPPVTLIRDDLDRLRKSDRYKGAFYLREETSSEKEVQPEEGDDDDVPVVPTTLQEEDDIREKPEEENVYKATPAPPEEEELKGSLLDWRG